MTHKNTHLLAYYFPSWHVDGRNEEWFGHGWTEWSLLSGAMPRFEGHRQPRVPLNGITDEADPREAGRQISLAKDHGLTGFLVDYYWYEDGPYLERALSDGLTKCEEMLEFTFALMWANHDLVDIFPSTAHDSEPQLIKSGRVSLSAFEAFALHVVDHYFTHPSYLKIDGKPWLSIYELGTLVEGLGGIDQTREALAWLDQLAREKGFPGVHFDGVVWGFGVLPRATGLTDISEVLKNLNFSSATSYVWIHHTDVTTHDFPEGDWSRVRADAFAEYEEFSSKLDIPFYPNVTVGWDSSPRTDQSAEFVHGAYPFVPVWDPTPEQFRDGLVTAKEFISRTVPPDHARVVTVNAWNEWTEGSVLLPDTHNGHGMLEQIAKVFGSPIEHRK